MTVVAILCATLVAGIGSVWLAAALMGLGLLDPVDGGRAGAQRLLSLAAGALSQRYRMKYLLFAMYASRALAVPIRLTLSWSTLIRPTSPAPLP